MQCERRVMTHVSSLSAVKYPLKLMCWPCKSKSRGGGEMYIVKLCHPLLVGICRDLAPLTENKNLFPEL